MGILVKLIEAFFNNSTQNETSSYGKASKNKITCKIYSVKGKNPNTKRMKTVNVAIASDEPLENVQAKSKLLPPYELKEIPFDMPSEKQIAYAKKCGISLPTDATKTDVSIFLTRYEEGKALFPPSMPEKTLRYLIDKGIFVPAYASKDEANNLYFYNIDLIEQIAYFGMKVYCVLKRKKYCILEDADPSERELFFEFASQYSNNDEFLKSLSHYSGDDLPIDSCSISKKLKAYNIAVDFFVK